jgi:hypothetical protein
MTSHKYTVKMSHPSADTSSHDSANKTQSWSAKALTTRAKTSSHTDLSHATCLSIFQLQSYKQCMLAKSSNFDKYQVPKIFIGGSSRSASNTAVIMIHVVFFALTFPLLRARCAVFSAKAPRSAGPRLLGGHNPRKLLSLSESGKAATIFLYGKPHTCSPAPCSSLYL